MVNEEWDRLLSWHVCYALARILSEALLLGREILFSPSMRSMALGFLMVVF
jgi:hypothetical protein